MKPIAITMGDACGIGPEIIVKAVADAASADRYPAVVIGSLDVIRRAAVKWTPNLNVLAINDLSAYRPARGVLHLLESGALPSDLPVGRVDARAGAAAADAIRRAVDLAMSGQVSAICTAPIHKEALAAAGVGFPGHTEMLAELSGSGDIAMVLECPGLRTMLVTVHCALRDAIAKLSIPLELRILRLAHRTLQAWGIPRPRIAVAGLNPHAGEGGLFGSEDAEVIGPAVLIAKSEGIDASGHLPPDTVFMQARRGMYDLVVAQYHDQGLIPVKLLGVEDGVNITAGLPFVRTSPDHGTAFDIAGTGRADPRSLKTAIATAHRLTHGDLGRIQ